MVSADLVRKGTSNGAKGMRPSLFCPEFGLAVCCLSSARSLCQKSTWFSGAGGKATLQTMPVLSEGSVLQRDGSCRRKLFVEKPRRSVWLPASGGDSNSHMIGRSRFKRIIVDPAIT